MCFAYTNKIPKNVEELDKFSHDAFLQSAQRDQNVGQIAIAYTVWSKKKGGGKLIVNEVFKRLKIKSSKQIDNFVTINRYGNKISFKKWSKTLQINETTQNFEYKLLKKLIKFK